MRKYTLTYIIGYFVTILLIVTKGINVRILLNSFNDAEKGIIDGFSGNNYILIINVALAVITLIAFLTTTISKKNKIRGKIIFLIIYIILFLYIPIGVSHYSGGFAGITREDYITLINSYMLFR